MGRDWPEPGVLTQLRPLPTTPKPSTGLSSAAAWTVTPCTAALATVFERIMECNPSAEIEITPLRVPLAEGGLGKLGLNRRPGP